MEQFDNDRLATIKVYQSPEGVAAYVAKEEKNAHADDARTVAMKVSLEGIPLQGSRVLDVGCGFGRDMVYFRSQGANVYGIDVSAGFCDEAVQKYGLDAQSVKVMDILEEMAPPFSGQFDVVWMYHVLLHVPRTYASSLFVRMASWLKPGGILIIHTKLGTGEFMKDNLGSTLSRLMVLYTPEELMEILTPLGFVQEWVSAPKKLVYGDIAFGLRVRKT